MTIKLSDYIKDTSNVFTLEEAEQIYKMAGYIDKNEILKVFEWYRTVTNIINALNQKESDWKEELFVDFVLHKIRGYNFEKLSPLNNLTNLELIKLIDNYKE